MKRACLIGMFFSVTICVSTAQSSDSKWSVLFGGQASYGMEADPEIHPETREGLLSGYSPAYSLGALSTLVYQASPAVDLCVTLGADVHRFSYDVLSAPTFGEVNGRTVPGRNLTQFKGLGASGIFELGTDVRLGASSRSPFLILRMGARYWVNEHSNADEATYRGFQTSTARDDARHQSFLGLGFGVSPISENSRLSIVYQRTTESFEPLHNMLILRQTFRISKGSGSVTCPKF